MKTTSLIEPLEARIAPATLAFINPTTATYSDVDGDLVTVKFSKGILSAGNLADVLITAPAGPLGGEQLQKIDLTIIGLAASPDGTAIAITAKPQNIASVLRGDGLANVGHIDGTGHDLGAVKIVGDLGQIDAGDATTTTAALKSLNALSIGQLGTTTQAGGDLHSEIKGALGSLTVGGNVKGAFIDVTPLVDGKIGSITIGGSVVGAMADNTGRISASGSIGKVKVGGNIEGGGGFASGRINAGGALGSVTIGGSLLGGTNVNSGSLVSGDAMGAVKIGGNIQGGSSTSAGAIGSNTTIASVTVGGSLIGGAGASSGGILASLALGPVKIGGDVRGGSQSGAGRIISPNSTIASVTIGGSLIGGSATDTGIIESVGALGAVKIGGDVRGGSISGTAFTQHTGYIHGARIVSVFIGGSLIAGTDTSSSSLVTSAAIVADDDIGSVTVLGSLVGNRTGDAVDVTISARGQNGVSAASKTDVAIGKITIGGRVEFATILAGYDVLLVAQNADAQVGTVTVGGDWISSHLIAGVQANTGGFGDRDDSRITGGKDNVATSKIASLIIKGSALGTLDSIDTALFGIEAQQLGKITIGGTAVALVPGVSNDLFAARRVLGAALGTGDIDGFDFHAIEVI